MHNFGIFLLFFAYNILKVLTFHIKSIIIIFVLHRGVEQLAARRAHNPEVVSSSLTPATKYLELS